MAFLCFVDCCSCRNIAHHLSLKQHMDLVQFLSASSFRSRQLLSAIISTSSTSFLHPGIASSRFRIITRVENEKIECCKYMQLFHHSTSQALFILWLLNSGHAVFQELAEFYGGILLLWKPVAREVANYHYDNFSALRFFI